MVVFRHDGQKWEESNLLLTSNLQAGDALGVSVATDGLEVLVTTPGDDDGAADAGAATVWLLHSPR